MPLIALPLLLAAATLDVPQYPTIQIQARTNLIVNDNGFNLPPGASFNSITVDMNDAAQVTFEVQVVPGRAGESVWFGGNGTGSLRCDAENDLDATISDSRVNNAGVVAWSQSGGALPGVYTCDPASGVETRVTAGPLGASVWGSPDINDSGQIGYRAGFGSGQAWVSFASGSFAVHATEQSIDVGSPYNFLFTPSFDNLRRIAGQVRAAAAAPVPEHREVRVFTSGGASTLIAVDNVGNAASPYNAFDNSVGLNDAGQVAFNGRLVAGNVRTVVRSDGATSTEIARVGVAGVTEIEFFAPAINASGLVAFRGRDANGQAIFVGDGTTLRRVVGKGDIVPSDLGPAEIGQNDASAVFGGGVAINANGDVAFTAALHPPGNNQVEWGTGVYVAYAAIEVLFRNGFE
jgi:hypothetical protein